MFQEQFNLKRPRQETNKKAAIELVLSVRDVPFALGADGNVEGLFEDSVSGCARKHLYLFPRLQEYGYSVDIGITQFDWRELPIPDKILSLLKEPIQYHMFLYIGVDRPVAELDVTWDKGMESLGFPVYDWDGANPTGIAVKAFNPRRQNLFLLKARSIASSTLMELRDFNREQPTVFNDAFNAWLAEMRGLK